MKIAFLVTRLDKPSARYRVFQYLPYFEREGYAPQVRIIPKTTWGRLKLFREMKDVDIVFLQKKLINAFEWHMLRKNARRLFYDFDDAVMFNDPQGKEQSSRRKMNAFLRTVKNADIVIAGNNYLKGLAAAKNPKTVVIPTSLDMNRYTEKLSGAVSDSITLGWIGSSATLFYLGKMKQVLDSIYDRFPYVRLKILADDFFDCDRMPVVKKKWSYEDEIGDLHTFDIGLMPLTDDPWSRGKCGLKLLQYMAVGIPSVCSPVGVNREIVTEGVNGFLAHDDAEWVEKINILITDPQVRLRMGKEARETVVRHYSTENSSKTMIALFNTVKRQASVCSSSGLKV